MAIVTVEKNRYTSESLYQWDKNQILEIYGLSLASIPEIHFTNAGMDRAIVRQASMDDFGIITVEVPNSMLQKSYDMSVYVCAYNGETFETLYNLVVPVDPRAKPLDYTLETNDDEVYSFNKLENQIANMLVLCEDLDEAVNTCTEAANSVAQYDRRITDIETVNSNQSDSIKSLQEDDDSQNKAILETSLEMNECKNYINLLAQANGIDFIQSVKAFGGSFIDGVKYNWIPLRHQMNVTCTNESATTFEFCSFDFTNPILKGQTITLEVTGGTTNTIYVSYQKDDISFSNSIANNKVSWNYGKIDKLLLEIKTAEGYTGQATLTIKLSTGLSHSQLLSKISAIENTLNSLSIWEGGSY